MNKQNTGQLKKMNIVRDAFVGIAVSSGVGFLVASFLMVLAFGLAQ
jgi:high-affinity Fe2+/Pb2+ permease